jgi:hypothetical protein
MVRESIKQILSKMPLTYKKLLTFLIVETQNSMRALSLNFLIIWISISDAWLGSEPKLHCMRDEVWPPRLTISPRPRLWRGCRRLLQ